MKATPLLISWHDDNAPIYSTHFDPHGKGRLATAGNDNNVRLWKIETSGEERRVTYLSTLIKHTQAVNVVRFSPKGEMLASAGDDGNVLLWVPSELQPHGGGLGEDRSDDKETWRVKHMCRSSGAEIYDLAWSPDGVFFITGSMDNIARIYNAQTGQMVRQIAEHSHYVQGVAWDPLNEFVATQSSDRSVHIYTLKTKDGQFTLTSHGKFVKMDLPARRISSSSPVPPDVLGLRTQSSTNDSLAISSPVPSAPGTPMTTALPMDPPPVSHSRRSSFGSSPSMRRSASPAPSMPLPAVKPLEVSSPGLFGGLGVKNASIYANETFTSFFRRLTFAPDGSLLFTPAGQYKTSHGPHGDPPKTSEEVINTVYIYTRAGFNKPPIAHLPGQKKPSVAVKCSPVFYALRQGTKPTRHITLDTSSGEDAFPSLPDSALPAITPTKSSFMEPPPPLNTSTSDLSRPLTSPKTTEPEICAVQGWPSPAFALPYRIIYAVATQDAVLVYDTQQQTPICIVSNLHYATFTDLTWSNDGLTLIMSSSDGFCSTLAFSPGELGQIYRSSTSEKGQHVQHVSTTSSTTTTPLPTPTFATSPSLSKLNPTFSAPTPPCTTTSTTTPITPARPTSPTGSTTSSITQVSTGIPPISTSASGPGSNSNCTVINNPTPTLGSVPSVTATNSAPPPFPQAGLPLSTPPQTPMSGVSHSATSSVSGSVLGKRDICGVSESERDEARDSGRGDNGADADGEVIAAVPAAKKRRIAPTLISGEDTPTSAPAPPTSAEK
ncbi:chromatin assembly factor 1 subunit B [Histoplasma capsulatum var. duboisii H88]|uniref:Chromatin assembly factor 1 subunit B n=1 Tax=Ajellomyces capsulatus (strain H88) TaxID=544711 RepID=A0A8A1L9A9_AJEC8|nr:chromatin assembly factor 1 subunit B [Histoplasma capsulatum var. duboisii H88]